jgi:hypothetical protein
MLIFLTTAFNILQKNDTTPGSESLCTTYLHIGMLQYHISFNQHLQLNWQYLSTNIHTPNREAPGSYYCWCFGGVPLHLPFICPDSDHLLLLLHPWLYPAQLPGEESRLPSHSVTRAGPFI